MMDDLIPRVEQQLSAIITAGSGDVSERTLRQYGKRIMEVKDIEALIARVRELEAQAAADAVAVEALMAVYEAGRGYVYNTNGDRGEALFLALNRALVGAMAALAAREVAE